MSPPLFNRLRDGVGLAVARLAQGHEVAEVVSVEVRREPTERDAMVHIGTRRSARLASSVVSGASLSLLSGPIRPAMVRRAVAAVAGVQRADAVFVAASPGAKPSRATRGPRKTCAAPDAAVQYLPIGGRAARCVLARGRTMPTPTVLYARGESVEFCAAITAIKEHGKGMGRC